MKTDLAELFAPYATKETLFLGRVNHASGDEYERFWKTLKASQTSQLSCFVSSRDSLWDIPRIGLLLADVVLLIGADYEKTFLHAFKNLENPIELEFENKAIAHSAMPAFLSFPPRWLQDWVEDAAPLIASGRLFYSPLRAIYYEAYDTENQLQYGAEPVRLDAPWNEWRAQKAQAPPPHQFLVANDVPVLNPIPEMLSCTLPFLTGVSLKSFHDLIEEEENSLTLLRAEISKVIPIFESEQKKAASMEKLLILAKEVRRDLIEPQIAKIDMACRKIKKYRSLKMAGIGIGTTALALNGISPESFGHIFQSIVGSSGFGLLAKEYVECQKELDELKSSPWYFAWRLGKISRP